VSGLQPWEEFSFLGKKLRAGSIVLEPIKAIDRCFAIDVAPGADTRDTNLLPAMERAFGHHDCGVYARIIAGGEIGLGDELRMEG
jgi:MOSC domain-containing protein YiiM